MELVFKTPADQHYFFGYYDKSALDKNGRFLLAHNPSFIDRPPEPDDEIPIGFFDINDPSGKFIKLTTTRAWNWQQGSMLQWMGPDHETKIIYNDRVNDKFVSIIYDLLFPILCIYQ